MGRSENTVLESLRSFSLEIEHAVTEVVEQAFVPACLFQLIPKLRKGEFPMAQNSTVTRTWEEIIPYGPHIKEADRQIDYIQQNNDFILYIGSIVAPPFRGQAMIHITIEFESEESAETFNQVIVAIRQALQLSDKPNQDFDAHKAAVEAASAKFGNDIEGFIRHCNQVPV
jgi:hypothetical protein